jgi:hypothetical protein
VDVHLFESIERLRRKSEQRYHRHCFGRFVLLLGCEGTATGGQNKTPPHVSLVFSGGAVPDNLCSTRNSVT